MPIIKSAIKRAKQSVTRRSRNLQVKRAVKQDIQAVHEAVSSGDASQLQAKLAAAYSEIDRAVKKGTLHSNTAARRKSQLAATVAQVASPETAPAKPTTTKGATKKATVKKATTKKPAAKKPAAKTASKAPAKAPARKPTEK
jgi:small subunit ribosomal protein S20